MDRNRKYLGMTVPQLGILAALAGGIFLLFCVTGYLLLRNGLGLSAAPLPPTPTSTLQPTPTLILSPTPTATPAPTAVPYESLIPAGWVQYKTALFELWLPAGYKTATKVDVLTTGLGGDPIVDLSLRGATSAKSPNKIYVQVSYEPITAPTFDDFINQRIQTIGLPPSERSKITLNTVPALRLVFSGRRGNNVDINELTYVIQDGGVVWYVQYTAELTEYFNLLATFESSAKTFRVVK